VNKIGNKYSISSLTNEKIKIINSLSQRKYRKQLNLFVAEGIRLCKEALDKNWEIKYLLYDKDKAEDELVIKLIDQVISRGGDALEVTFNILSKISHKENAQNVLGVIEQQWSNLPKKINKETWVALECIRDPGNLGTIFRTMDAVGAKGCFLIDECTDPFSYEAVRASMGAIFNINIISINSKEFIEWRKEGLFTLIGTSLNDATDYRKAHWSLPFILLMGNEQRGLSDQLIAECDQLIKIPMLGSSDSLNLAVSTAVALYESIRENPI
jgi:RNA methyltransferase, TrmH family